MTNYLVTYESEDFIDRYLTDKFYIVPKKIKMIKYPNTVKNIDKRLDNTIFTYNTGGPNIETEISEGYYGESRIIQTFNEILSNIGGTPPKFIQKNSGYILENMGLNPISIKGGNLLFMITGDLEGLIVPTISESKVFNPDTIYGAGSIILNSNIGFLGLLPLLSPSDRSGLLWTPNEDFLPLPANSHTITLVISFPNISRVVTLSSKGNVDVAVF